MKKDKVFSAVVCLLFSFIFCVGCGAKKPSQSGGEPDIPGSPVAGPIVNKENIKADYSLYDLNHYDNAKYMQYFWDNEVMYNESASVLRNEDGSLPAVNLLYRIDKIISVRSADLNTLYREGIDYKVEEGKLIILENGTIPVMPYDMLYTDEKIDGYNYTHTVDGKYLLCGDGGVIYKYQIAVTYYHADKGTYTVPATQADKLVNFTKKLENKEDVTVVVFGDSISYGWSSTGITGEIPHMPNYAGLLEDYLKERFGYDGIHFKNLSVSGYNSGQALGLVNNVIAENPDLLIVAFGMNDGAPGLNYSAMGKWDYSGCIGAIVNRVRANNPDCSVILVSTMLPNGLVCWQENGPSIFKEQENYLDVLAKISDEKENVALADMTSMHKEYLGVKSYYDMTGNNVNHPNDFLTRLYAQTILKTIFPADNATETELALDDFEKITYHGRIKYGKDVAYIENTASGFEITVNGGSVLCDFDSSELTNSGKCYLAVYLDGVRQEDIILRAGRSSLWLAKNLNGEHTLKILKSTEAQHTSLELRRLAVRNGRFAESIKRETLKFEFLGDSITCGYGNLDPSSCPGYQTSGQDGLQTYATLTADAFGAECSIVAYSGYSVDKSQYNSKRTGDYFESYSQNVREKWNFEGNEQDVVVINLGTNDFTYYQSHMDELDTLKKKYVELVQLVRSKYPNAKIVLAYGMMNWGTLADTIGEVCNYVVSEFSADGNVYAVRLYTCEEETKGANGHPNVEAHRRAAEMLIEFLKSIGVKQK